VRNISKQDSKEGMTCVVHLQILEEWGCVTLFPVPWRGVGTSIAELWLSKQGELWLQPKSL